MTAQHTPGPWTTPDGEAIVDPNSSELIAQCYGDGIATITPEECNANARLIAAAPDMLAQLQCTDSHITRILQISDLNPDAKGRLLEQQDLIRAAIAKAGAY